MLRAKPIVLLTLFLVMSMLLFANLASADVTIQPWDIVYKTPPIITVNSPINNTIFYGNTVLLNFTITQPTGQWLIQYVDTHGGVTKQMLTGFGYVLNGKSYGSFPVSSDLSSSFNYCVNLTLDNGFNTLQVYGNASGYVVSFFVPQYVPITGWSNTIYFETFPPKPTVQVQPLDINGTSLSLNFTVDEPVSRITYSLDNQDNVSIAGNTTLTNLPYGHHNLTVYATNPAGNVGASQTINFTIAKQEAETFPTTTVAVVSVTVAVVVVAGLLVYHKKHKH
jgi:hypothetical protein